MLRTIDLRERHDSDWSLVVPRAPFDVEQALEQVRPVIAAVRQDGAEALRRFSQQWDGVTPEYLRVPAEELEQAAEALDPELRAAFEESIRRRRAVCEQVETERAEDNIEVAAGARISQRIVPVQRVGLYVPGGLAPLASSVIMNVVPAQVAGVKSIAIASPPQKDFDGLPHPNILALCHLLGIDEVYAVGGAQAIAMFAYGVPDLCPRVSMVTGPGNIYVVAAKRLVRSVVGIDSEAGPTEIAIIADQAADPRFVAADLISQAEHDPLAAAVLITDSEELAEATRAAVETQVATARHRERITTALSGEQSAIVVVRDIDQAVEVADAYAAEHLEIHTVDAPEVAARISNAGAIFVGPWSPVSLGDYSAGSTHVLPTAGCACHSSGLSVRSFMRAVHVIDYSQEALLEIASGVELFAEAEDLPSHGAAITVRRPEQGDQQ